jgi:hypothetical protein
VQNLTTPPGADNAEQIALVRRGAELAHQLLIAQNRVALADQRIAASQSQAARAAELVQQAGALADGVQLDAAGVRQVGLLAIRIAGANAEALNSMAFSVARAVWDHMSGWSLPSWSARSIDSFATMAAAAKFPRQTSPMTM